MLANPFKSINYYTCNSSSGITINGTGIINIINGSGNILVIDGNEVCQNIPTGSFLFNKSVKVYAWTTGYNATFTVGLFN